MVSCPGNRDVRERLLWSLGMMIRRYTASSTAGTIAILQRGKYLAMIFHWTHMFWVKNRVPVSKKNSGFKN